MKRPARKVRRKGFTLMEILLVMAILVVVASMGTFAWLSMQRKATSDAAYTHISTLANACIAYKISVQRFPATLDDLYRQPQGLTKQMWGGPYIEQPKTGMLVDPWGNPYNYTADEANDTVYITSAGPDQQPGTEDDVTNAPRIQGG